MKNEDILFCTDKMKEHYKEAMAKDYEIHRDLKVENVPNGIIHPLEIPEGGRSEYLNYGGVTDENLNFIELSLMKRDKAYSMNEDDVNKMFIGANPNRDFSNIDYIDETVVYIGPMHCHIAHFYLECFSRWWYFLDYENLKYKVAYIPMLDGSKDFHKEFFELIGIKKEQLIEINKPIKFKSVIVPEQSFSLNVSYHKKYKELVDKISENIEPLGYKKVYFSKTIRSGDYIYLQSENRYIRRNQGSDLMDEIYLENGYEILYPERLSIKNMIATLKNCEEFVAQSGSNAHNAIFLSDNAKITILNRSAHFHPCQTMINRLRNLKVTYVDVFCEALPIDWSYGPFIFFYTNELKQYLTFNNFKYSDKLEREGIINIREHLVDWEDTYTKFVPKSAIHNLNIDKSSFIEFVLFVNKYIDKIYKSSNKKIKIFNRETVRKKSWLFGFIQKEVGKDLKIRWKILGKEFLRYKTKMYYMQNK